VLRLCQRRILDVDKSGSLQVLAVLIASVAKPNKVQNLNILQVLASVLFYLILVYSQIGYHPGDRS
jgi:uncharacterized membrane protein YhaH (DUF805 family)